VAEITIKRLLCWGFGALINDGTSVSMLMEDISRNKCFYFSIRISHILRFISICDVFTNCPSYHHHKLLGKIYVKN
jgi:hypothetical protein